jgi:putative flippase GtrA
MLYILDNINSLYQSNSKEVRRFVKFSIVGAVGAIIDFTLLNLLHGAWDWPLFWANTISVSAAIVSNFTWNRLWTYPESRSL